MDASDSKCHDTAWPAGMKLKHRWEARDDINSLLMRTKRLLNRGTTVITLMGLNQPKNPSLWSASCCLSCRYYARCYTAKWDCTEGVCPLYIATLVYIHGNLRPWNNMTAVLLYISVTLVSEVMMLQKPMAGLTSTVMDVFIRFLCLLSCS